MTNNVKVIKSGSWADQAEQNWCFKYKPNHARPERYRWKNVQEKTTTTKTIKRQVLVHTENEWVVSLDIFDRVWGQKPIGRTWAHRTETDIRTNAHRLILFALSLLSLPCHHSYLLHLGIPLIISSHASIGVCLSGVFGTTQDSSVFLSVSYTAPHEMAVS